MTSSQESRNPSSSGSCCFNSGDEFSSKKNKQNQVGEAKQSSSKQNKNIKALRYSCSDVICHQSFITLSTSLGVAKAGNLKLDFHFFGLENIFRCYREIPKPKKAFLAIWTL